MKLKFLNIFIAVVIFLQFTIPVQVFADEEKKEIEITAVSAILIDRETGRVLYEKNADQKNYPASMTKVLTSLLCMEYIKPEENIVVGTEINFTPWDSTLAGLEVGETISGKNLIRGLIIPSGNEASNTVAAEVVRRKTGETNLSYAEMEKKFAELMNERAKSLGATNSNFVTPSGYHDENHYTTARDMALIATEAMKNETIAEVAAEISYYGPSVETGVTPDMKIVEHQWYTHNQIINPKNPYYYKNANGIKTGYTEIAGECLVATASMKGEELLLVLFNSPDPNRWIDAKKLFDYGFSTYENVELQTEGSIIQEIAIDDPIKGQSDVLNVLANENVTALLTKDEIEKVIHTIEFNPAFLSDVYTDTGSPKIKAPLVAGEEIGTIQYKIGDELLYEGPVISATDVNKRTFLTDMQFYSTKVKDFVFSWKIVPLSVSLFFAGIYIIRGYKQRQLRKKRVKFKSKYGNFRRKY